MSYASNDELIARVGTTAAVQLTTDTGTTPDAAVVTEARTAAEALIDRWLGRRYATPVDVVTHADAGVVLKALTLDLAEYTLCARRTPVDKDVRQRHEDAVAWLEKAAGGEVVLPAAVTPAATTADDPLISVGSDSRLMD